MAEGRRSSDSGERRVYRNGSAPPARAADRTTAHNGGDAPGGRGARQKRRVRGRRPLWQRIALALMVVLAVAAVSFFIGYLIGLKLAVIAFAIR
jgi:hypothetical protein